MPSAMKLQVLDKIHEGHQGIVKCRERAKTSVWWPGLSREVYLVVEYVFLTLYRGGCFAKRPPNCMKLSEPSRQFLQGMESLKK